jgi:hypothetical protein
MHIMKKTPSLLLATLLASLMTAPPTAFSAPSSAPGPLTKPAVPVSKDLHITIDPRSYDVVINKKTISRLEKGQVISVTISDTGNFDYVLDYVTQNADVLEVGGHIVDDANQKITLGIRGDGITGIIDTPKLNYALGYANKVQMAGVPSSQWMAKELAAEPAGMTIREARKDEILPARGAPCGFNSRKSARATGHRPGLAISRITAQTTR